MASAPVAVFTLLLCCGTAQGLRHVQTITTDFVACDSPGPCGSGGVKWQYLLDLLRNVNSSAVRKLEAGRTPTLLHIGAADLANSADFADQDLYRKVASTLSQAVNTSLKLVLVEPNEFFLPTLKRNVQKLPLAVGNVYIVSGMVAGSCNGFSSSMYRFSHQPSRDFGANYGTYGSWFSTKKNFPWKALKGLTSNPPSSMRTADLDALRRFAMAPNLSSYVEEVNVPCFTPASLLAATGSVASDLAMVVTDAESKDWEIVHKLLKLPGFRPGYLQWEGSFPEMADLGLELQHMNFTVGNTAGGAGNHDAGNCVAVATD